MPILTSNFKGFKFTGTPQKIAAFWERVAGEATEPVAREEFLQQAEHYIRLSKKGETK